MSDGDTGSMGGACDRSEGPVKDENGEYPSESVSPPDPDHDCSSAGTGSWANMPFCDSN